MYVCVCVYTTTMSSRALNYWQTVASLLYHPASTYRWCLHMYEVCRTHSANAVAGTQGAHKGASALQHGTDDRLRDVELIPDGLADCWHVWKQHH